MSHENSQHIVVVGTKPDIIKQAPIYHELRERGQDVVLCHTGQHYDHNLSQSMLDEFGQGRVSPPLAESLSVDGPGQPRFSDLTYVHLPFSTL